MSIAARRGAGPAHVPRLVSFRQARCLLLASALSLLCPQASPGDGEPVRSTPRHGYAVSERPAPEPASPLLGDRPDLDGFTVDAVRARLPARLTGRTARVMPVDELYFLHASNVIEMDRVWAAVGDERPLCVVLGSGSYDLESVHAQIDDPSVLVRLDDGSYLLRRPLLVTPTGTLAVADGERLLLSATDGVFVYSTGELIVVDAEITAWDRHAGAYPVRETLSPERALRYLEQTPRPYILGAEGSRTYIASSRIRGLGFKGKAGTFGLSMTPVASGSRLGRYLRRLPRPTGWLIGNDIEDLFFGFYSNRARDVAIVGNRFRDNVVYAVDPHDYTERLVVARNVAQGSRHAHGIIFSRGVTQSWVVDNVAVGNAGSGVMLDRESSDNRIVGNLLMANEGDGVAVFESSRNLIAGNAVRRNLRNGIHVRNSEDVRIEANEIVANGASGVEVAAVDISDLETRDFAVDPFVERAAAQLWHNRFVDNGRSAVKTRSVAQLSLFENEYVDSGPAYFAGDVEDLGATLLARELRRSGETVITGRSVAASAAPVKREHGDAGGRDDRVALDLLRRQAEAGVPRAMVSLAREHARRSQRDPRPSREVLYWYGRAIANGWPSALAELAYLLLLEPAYAGEAIVLLAMAERLGDRRARDDLALLPHLVEVPQDAIAAARREARTRLAARALWNAELFADLAIRLTAEEAAQAHRRMRRMVEELARGRPPLATTSSPGPAPRLDAGSRAAYLAKAEAKNEALARYLRRLAAQAASDARAIGERRAQLDRVERRHRARELRVAAVSDAERRLILQELERRLVLINRHRDPAARLEAGELAAAALASDARQAGGGMAATE